MMRFDLNNPHLLVEPIYGDVMITFKDARIADEKRQTQLEQRSRDAAYFNLIREGKIEEAQSLLDTELQGGA